MVLLPNDASLGMLLEVVFIKREVKALALNCGRGKRGTFSHSSLGQEATSPSDHAFGAIILAINPWVWSSKSSSSSVKSKRLLFLNCARGKRGTFSHSLLGQDATIQI